MGTVAIVGECDDCNFICESKNALGVMAKHSKKYNHTVRIEQTVCYKFVNGEREYWEGDKENDNKIISNLL